MATTLRPPGHIRLRLGPTLRGRPTRKRPVRAAVRAATRIAVIAFALFLVLDRSEPGTLTPTLFFGIAAALYLMADFLRELPTPAELADDHH